LVPDTGAGGVIEQIRPGASRSCSVLLLVVGYQMTPLHQYLVPVSGTATGSTNFLEKYELFND